MSGKEWDWHDAQGFGRIINVSGTMTGLGASVTSDGVRAAMDGATRNFVRMHELQARASRTIAQLTGSEAGFLTASASAGISLAVGGCVSGLDAARAEALPRDPGPKAEVAVQLGHLCGYGAPIETAVALTGARVRPVGQSTLAMDHQLQGALTETTAAAHALPLPRGRERVWAAWRETARRLLNAARHRCGARSL